MREYDFEPVRGLPERLPPGEEMLWQGAPRWTALARRAFHVWKIAFYFGLIVLWRVAADLSTGENPATVVAGALWILLLALLAIGALALLAFAMARSTVYTITSRRVVMRFGVALPMIVNFPFAQIRSAQMKSYPDDTGDLPLVLAESARVSYLVMWPHVRPWHFARPQPMLRAIPDVAKVAGVLSDGLTAFAAQSEAHVEPVAGQPGAESVSSAAPSS